MDELCIDSNLVIRNLASMKMHLKQVDNQHHNFPESLVDPAFLSGEAL